MYIVYCTIMNSAKKKKEEKRQTFSSNLSWKKGKRENNEKNENKLSCRIGTV